MACGIVTQLVDRLGGMQEGNVLKDVSTTFEGAGIHALSATIKKGMTVVQHKHTYDHLSILLKGKVFVVTDDWSLEFTAPAAIVIKADTYHAVEALEDSEWLCIHKAGE